MMRDHIQMQSKIRCIVRRECCAEMSLYAQWSVDIPLGLDCKETHSNLCDSLLEDRGDSYFCQQKRLGE